MRVALVLVLCLFAPLAAAAPELTAVDLDAFFDGYIPAAIARGDVAGAEIAVVKDGQILFEKGYGVSNLATRKPVDPRQTLFRAGSVGMLVTWAAVNRLADQGKLDLDRDINDYLDFRIPPTWPKQITLRDLIAQQSGFEDIAKGVLTFQPGRMARLGPGVRADLPERIFPAGQVTAFSNYGAALAGAVVERAGGQPFESAAAERVFQPLGMLGSSFAQPLPPALATTLATGYRRASEPAEPFEYFWMSPAQGLSTTADDMARFMIAQLKEGGALPGYAHRDANGHRLAWMIGDTPSFRSSLTLMPDAGIGVYYAQNSAGNRAGDFRRPMVQSFLDRYFPAPAGEEPTLLSARADGAVAAGAYQVSRQFRNSFLRLAGLRQLTVFLNEDGTLAVDAITGPSGKPIAWREVTPFHWREVGGPGTLSVRLEGGQPVEIVTDALPPFLTVTRASPLRSEFWSVPLLAATLALQAWVVFIWPVGGLLRALYRRSSAGSDQSPLLRGLVWLVALVDLVFLGGFIAFIRHGLSHPDYFSADQDWIVQSLHGLGFVAVLAIIIAILAARAGFQDRRQSWVGKLGALIPVFASLSVIWFALMYHLIGFSTGY